MCKESKNSCCCIFSIVSILITGIGIASIFYGGLIISVPALLYVTLILGIIALLYIIFTALCGNKFKCEEIKNECLIVSSVGAIITSTFALTATTLATFSLASALLIGAVAFFLNSTIISLLTIILSRVCKNNYCE